MFANPDFHGFGRQLPPPFPKPSIEWVPADGLQQSPEASQIYAAAWSQALRDHELDKLFNAEFYQSRDI